MDYHVKRLISLRDDRFKDNFKVIFYEDFRKDNKGTLDDICKFLDIKKFDNIRNIESNLDKFNLDDNSLLV